MSASRIVAGCTSTPEPTDAGGDGTAEGAPDAPASNDGSDAGVSDANAAPCELARLTHDPLGCQYDLFGFLESQAAPHSYACQAVLISNPTSFDATLKLTYKGLVLDLTTAAELVTQQGLPYVYSPMTGNVLAAGGSAVVALIQGDTTTGDPYPSEHCPFPAAENLTSFVVPAGTTGTAMNLSSTAPVYVSFIGGYAVSPNLVDDNVSAASIRSIESWSTRFRDVGLYMAGMPPTLPTKGIPLSPEFISVVASTNGKVTVDTDGAPKVWTTSLDSVVSIARNDEQIGQLVQSTSPVGLWSRSINLFVPYDASDALYAAHGVPETSAWSNEYAVVQYPARYDAIPDPAVVRIVADVDGTILSYDPAQPSGAPTQLDAGGFAVFDSSAAPFVVRSQDPLHPFYVDMLMTNAVQIYQPPDSGDPASLDARGNPAIVSPLPLADFAQHVAFLTAPDFPDTWLVITRHRGAQGFADVNLDCAGAITGWTAVDSSDMYEFAYVALSRGDFQTQPYAGGTCALGPHTLDSGGYFSVAVWGWGSAATATDAQYGTIADAYALTPFGYQSLRATSTDAGVVH